MSRRCSAYASRAATLPGVSSYRSAASLAGPRRSDVPRTSTTRGTGPSVTSSRSPTLTSRLGFTAAPLTCTRPPLTASAARPRGLNRRAAHSHLSMRPGSDTPCAGSAGRHQRLLVQVDLAALGLLDQRGGRLEAVAVARGELA